MDFENEKLGCKFALPDHPTVRQQLAFWSEFSEARGAEKYEKFFAGALPLIDKWECAVLPDPHVDLDSITSPGAALVITWVGNQAFRFINGLEEVPKNA